jgi:hypothetical protein
LMLYNGSDARYAVALWLTNVFAISVCIIIMGMWVQSRFHRLREDDGARPKKESIRTWAFASSLLLPFWTLVGILVCFSVSDANAAWKLAIACQLVLHPISQIVCFWCYAQKYASDPVTTSKGAMNDGDLTQRLLGHEEGMGEDRDSGEDDQDESRVLSTNCFEARTDGLEKQEGKQGGEKFSFPNEFQREPKLQEPLFSGSSALASIEKRAPPSTVERQLEGGALTMANLYAKQSEDMVVLKNVVRQLQEQLDFLHKAVGAPPQMGQRFEEQLQRAAVDSVGKETAPLTQKSPQRLTKNLPTPTISPDTTGAEQQNSGVDIGGTNRLSNNGPPSNTARVVERAIDKWKRRSSGVGSMIGAANITTEQNESAEDGLRSESIQSAELLSRQDIAAGEKLASKWKLKKSSGGGGTFVLSGEGSVLASAVLTSAAAPKIGGEFSEQPRTAAMARRGSVGGPAVNTGDGYPNKVERRKSLQQLVLGGAVGGASGQVSTKPMPIGGDNYEKKERREEDLPFVVDPAAASSDVIEGGGKKYSF